MIRSGRHPHEVVILSVFALASVAGVAAPYRVSGQTLLALPPFSLYLFYIVLGAGSFLSLVGVFLRGIKGPVVEMYGLGVLSLNLAGYGVAIWGLLGSSGTFFGLLTVGIALGNVWRIVQVFRELKLARVGEAAARVRSAGEE